MNDPSHIPAQHFQNHRVPADTACYACHADYTIYGPMKDKLQGMNAHLHAVREHAAERTIPIPGGFKNSQCLHCHLGARGF